MCSSDLVLRGCLNASFYIYTLSCYTFLSALCFSPPGRAVQFSGQPFPIDIWLRIEVDAVWDSDEHIAVGDAIVLSHAHTDTVASGINHGFEVTGGVDSVVDGALGGVGCAGEHGEIGPEAVGVASVNSGLTLLRGVVPGVAPVGADLSGIHQGFTDW